MPINHSRRLSQPKTRTFIDPVTNKTVVYSDYLKVGAERNKNDDNDSNVTPKKHNGESPDSLHWSDDNDEPDEERSHEHDDDQESPNKNTTESVLDLGTDTASAQENTNNDASLQAQVNCSLSQKPHEIRKQVLQANAALRAKQLAAARKSKQTLTSKKSK